jgi:hypothetical protein
VGAAVRGRAGGGVRAQVRGCSTYHSTKREQRPPGAKVSCHRLENTSPSE